MSNNGLWVALGAAWIGVLAAVIGVESQSVVVWILLALVALASAGGFSVVGMAAASWLGSGPGGKGRHQAWMALLASGIGVTTMVGGTLWRLAQAVFGA